jgi:hypothetical protein
VRAVVICRVRELAIALQLGVVTSCAYKRVISPITNADPVYSQSKKS